MYDYGGFPTDLQLADRVYGLLSEANLPCSKKDNEFDHGVLVPIEAAFPAANIPVVQLSLKSNLNMAEHIRLGEVLAPLRDEGTLIICSGFATHNFQFGTPGGRDPRVVELAEWLRHNIEDTNYAESKAAFSYVERNCPHFSWAHPRVEHFIPLVVALGTSKPSTSSSAVPDVVSGTTIATATRGNKRIYHEIFLSTALFDSYLFN